MPDPATVAVQVWKDCLSKIDSRDKIVFVVDERAIQVITNALTLDRQRTTEAVWKMAIQAVKDDAEKPTKGGHDLTCHEEIVAALRALRDGKGR